MDWRTYLHSQWTENDEKIQEDQSSRRRVVLQVLAGQDRKLREYLCGQDNPEKEARTSRQIKSTLFVSQLVYEIRIHQQLSHPNVVYLDHWFEDDFFQYIFMEYCSEGVPSNPPRI